MAEEQFEEQQENAGADAETAAPESATGEQQESQPEATAEQESNNAFSRRIRDLTAARKRAEEDAEYWREQARKVSPQPEAPKEQPKPQSDAKPKADDFENHEDFVEALTDWKIEQRDQKRTQQSVEERARQEQQETFSRFGQRENEFRAQTPDYDEVMAGPEIKVSQSVIQEVLNHENGPQLKYWLAKNPAEAERLSKMKPMELAREVGRLEPRFTTPAAAPQASATRVPPAPITPISGSRGGNVATLDTDDYAAYEKRRYAELRR